MKVKGKGIGWVCGFREEWGGGLKVLRMKDWGLELMRYERGDRC